jgi:surfeit locus 1 family protein
LSESLARKQGLLSASFATLIAVAILVSLGFWQIHRLHWKERILAQIEAGEHAPPAELIAGDTPKLFTRVLVHGILRSGPVGLYGAEVRDDRMGAQLVEVLDRVGASPLLVVLGWVPTDHGTPQAVTGPIDVTGYVRLPETPGMLSASDDVEGRRFYTLNPATIGQALGAPDAAPLMLVALKNPLAANVPAGAPQPAEALPQPVNNHLQYAFTWFGLAGALLAVYLSWASKAFFSKEKKQKTF